jgi:hypothetical protein
MAARRNLKFVKRDRLQNCDLASTQTKQLNSMKPRDLFKLAIRLLGLVFLYHGLSAFPIVFGGIHLGGPSDFFVVWMLIVAFCLMKFAATIAHFFYPTSEED